MSRSHVTTFLVTFLAGAQLVHAQDSLDDVFAQLDAAESTGNTPVAVADAPVSAPASTPVAAAPVASDEAPTAVVVDAPAATVAVNNVVAAPVAVNSSWDLFQSGADAYRAGDLDKAKAVFEAVLAEDPYDTRAMTMLTRTNQKIASRESVKQSSSRSSAIADVESAWNPALKVAGAAVAGKPTAASNANEIAVALMTAKLQGVIIPSLDFQDATIDEVIMYLNETCRNLDVAGVNLMLLGLGDSSDVGNITISIRDMSLYETLQYVVEMASLKFDIQAKAVVITPVGYVSAADLKLVSFSVIPEVGTELESMAGGDDGVDDLFGDSSDSDATGPIDVAGFFSIVEWPEGSEASYNASFHKLFVKNTPKNISVVEAVLADLEDAAVMARSQQVEIEAKFVEYNEGALEELGVDWTMYGSGDVLGKTFKGSGYQPSSGYATETDVTGGTLYNNPITGMQQVSDPRDEGRPGQSLFGGNQRNNSSAFEALQSGVLATMGGTPAALFVGDDHVDIRITAMEQEGTADVLSAPKVTTKSGNEAIIKVVETHRYPQDYDVETGQRTSPVVKPQDWEDFDLGVVLKVTPVVDSESNTIDLDLEPEIKKFKGYDQYKVGSNAYESGGNDSSVIFGDGSALIARMPYFEVRSVQTQVTIADGSTVLMGGLVDERTETFRDQVPFLGDIPYLGRLFRTEGSRNVKKNLVIYVKATQVDDRGMTRVEREAQRQVSAN